MIPAIDDNRLRGKRERPWTAEHDRILIQLRESGLTLPIIAERLGRTANACSSRHSRLTGETPELTRPRDYLGERIESYLSRIASLNRYQVDDLKRQCYGWA